MPNSSPEYINETKNTMGSIQLPDARHYVGIGGSEVPYGEDGQDPSDRFKMKWRYDENMHETDNSPPQSPTKQPAGCYNYPLSDTKHPTQPPSSFTAWFKKYEVIIVISAIALIAVIMMWFKYILFLINQI